MYKIFILLFCFEICNAVIYDYYTGKIATPEQLAEYKALGNLDVCTIDIAPCNASEWKRVDGSCNNINDPSRGTYFIPLPRVLPACYYNGSYPRKAEGGEDLLLPRAIRRFLLSEGKSSDPHYTQAITSYGIFMFSDVGSIHDILFFLINKTDCCSTGMNDYMCTPNFFCKDEAIYRLGGVKCTNMTRPLTHQYFGCTKDPIPSPVVQATSSFDLSPIYNARNRGEKAVRTYKDGMILMEEERGMIWPPNGPAYCPLNKPGARCYGNHASPILPITLFVVWFMRLHNYYAAELAKVNPCWDDDRLFYTARDLNIASSLEMYVYEWNRQLQGSDYMEECGVISKDPGCRNVYNNNTSPTTTLEFIFIKRYFHTTQESMAKMYDPKGKYLRNFPIFNVSFAPGVLIEDDNMCGLTQNIFRQACGKFDQEVDYEVAINGMKDIQVASDLPTSDLHKGRWMGFSPYIDYVFYCTGHKIRKFSDLLPHICRENIIKLMKVYKHVRDIELLAGMWMEKPTKSGKMPRTMACLINDNLRKAIQADRHWYESCDRPHAFTPAQLSEIRKFNLALLLCSVADCVTEVQKHAFLNIGPNNPVVPCSEIPKFNFQAWADPACRA